MPPLEDLRARLDGLGRVLLGYSGGVDSAFLAAVALDTLGRDRFLAVIGRSPSYPDVQHVRAVALAHERAIPLLEIQTMELADPRYVANPTNRCYFCKHELWQRLGAVAQERGFDVVIDGTNADDLREHRPGLAAAAEHAVRSPLAEAGWTKPMVRRAARDLGLPLWNSPASPCLSSRVRYGVPVTVARLRQIEAAEAFLRSEGVAGDLRVRHLGAAARIEAPLDEHAMLLERWPAVRDALRALGFSDVELDPNGYRRGSLLVLGQPQDA